MFNHGNRGRRGGDNSGITNLSTAYIEARSPQVTINGYYVSGTDDLGLDIAGGQTIIISGGGFATGITGTIGGVSIGAITFISPTQLSFTSPAKSGGLYVLVLTNTNGNTGALVPGLVYSSIPTFTTPAGSIGSAYETTTYTKSVLATSDSAITYSLASGSLPAGATLDPVAGTISGTLGVIPSGSTTYSFAITATDNEKQDVTRSFTLTTSTDVLSWVTPSNGATINLDGTAYSQVLNATDGAGYSVSYSANALPTGLSLSSGTISGSPTVEGTTSTLLTATAATTTRSATNNITWVVSLGDSFWNYTTLLLNGSTTSTAFINDASLNNSQLTIAGDTKPTTYTPYGEGYFSYKFDGASYALGSTPTSGVNFGTTIGTSDFCLEGWGYWTSFNFGTYGAPLISLLGQSAGELMIRATKTTASTTTANFFSILGASTYIPSSMFSSGVSVGTLYLNRWHHLAMQRVSGTWYFYVDGVMLNSTSAGDASLTLPFTTHYIGSDAASGGGYMAGNASNIRLTVGTVPYTAAGFTVPTAPLTYLPTTKFLSAQSNRLIDNGPINCTFTTGGTANTGVQIAPFTPFTQPASMSVPNLYSTYFDGTSGYVSTPHNTQLSMDSGNFSAECWCYRTNTVSGESATLINKSGTGSVSVPQWLIGTTNGFWSYIIGSSGSSGTILVNVQTTTSFTSNVWHHVALVKTGTTYSLFLNGTRISSTTNATVPLDNNPLALSIGFQLAQTSLCYWWGQISDVRINKGTLPTGYDATQTSITVPTQKLTAVTGTVLLTCQDSTLKDNSTNNFPMSSVAPARPHPVTPFTQTYSSVTGLTTLGSSYFDGTGDYLTSTPAVVNNLSGTWTVEAWCYMTQAPTGNTYATSFPILTSENGAGTMYHYWGIGSTAFVCMVRDGSGYDTVTGTMPGTNQWFHVAVTNVGTTVSFYINGVLAGSKAQSAATWSASGTSINIGALYTYAYAKGYISDLRIINGTALYTSDFIPTYQPLAAITNTQLLTLQYNGGANNYGIIDNSGWLNPLTRLGNATQGTFSPYSPNGWSNYFNGTTDYLTITGGVAFGSGAWTAEAWFNCASFAATVSIIGAGSTSSRFSMRINTSTTIVIYGMTANITFTVPALNTNTWYHFVAVRDSSNNVTVFINGVRSSTGVVVDSAAMSGVTTTIGTHSTVFFPGYISNVRIVVGTAVYDPTASTLAVPTSPLTAILNTQFLSCQSNRFLDNSANAYALTLTGTPSVQAYSPFGSVTTAPITYSYNFNYADGTGDYISLPTAYSATLGAIANSLVTIEFWMFTTSISAVTSYYSGLFGNFTGSAVNGRLMVVAYGTSTTSAQTINITYTISTGATAAVTTTASIPQNTWAHVAITIDSTTPASSNIVIYINGVGQTFTGQNLSTHTTDPGAAFQLGSDGGGNYQQYSGYLSNFRYVRGTLVYTGNFTVPTGPLAVTQSAGTNIAAITGTATKLLTCQSNNTVEISNSVALTVTGTVLPKPFNPFGQTTTSKAAYNPTIHGGSMFCDGTGDYLTAPNSKSFDLSTGQWTIECWFYQLAAKQVQLFSVSAASWRLAVGSNGAAEFTFNTSSTTNYPAGTFPPGQWHHISSSFNADGTTSAQRSHANGKLVATGQFWPNADTTSLFYIGNNKDAAGAWDFNGYITDVRITKGQCYYYNSFYPNLTALPVNSNTAFMMNGINGGIVDAHSSNVLETVGNTQLASEDPYSGSYYSNYFDGTGDYLSNTTDSVMNFGTNDFTVEYWQYYTVAFNSNFQVAVGSPDSASNIAFGTNVSGVVYATTSTTGYTASAAIVQNVWQHIAWVRSSGTLKGYLNGVQVFSGSVTTSFDNVGFGVGGSKTGSYLLAGGYLSNIRVVKGQALYTTNFTPSTTPLTAISGTSLLTCQSNSFKDNSSNNFAITRNGDTKVKSMNPFQQNSGKSLYFDGTADRLSILDNPNINFGIGDFTIECWAYFNVVNAEMCLINKGWQSSSAYASYLLYMTSAGSLHFNSSADGGSWGIANDKVIATMTAGAWTHIAVTRSGTSFRAFINGAIVDAFTFTSSSSLANIAAQTLFIGGRTDGASSINGYLKDVRITKGVARYTTTFTPPAIQLKTK